MLRFDRQADGLLRALKEIRDLLPDDCMVVAKGASTMDISRQVINNSLPRRRPRRRHLGHHGVGLPQAIAAQVGEPRQRVVDIQGDSLRVQRMEVEVACRLKLPIVFVVLNNNGVGGGPLS